MYSMNTSLSACIQYYIHLFVASSYGPFLVFYINYICLVIITFKLVTRVSFIVKSSRVSKSALHYFQQQPTIGK